MSDSFLREDGVNAFDEDEFAKNGDLCASRMVNVVARASNKAYQQYTKRYSIIGHTTRSGIFNSYGIYGVSRYILDSGVDLKEVNSRNLGNDRLLAMEFESDAGWASNSWSTGQQFIVFTGGVCQNVAFALDFYDGGDIYVSTITDPNGLLYWDYIDANTGLFFPTKDDPWIVVDTNPDSSSPNDRIVWNASSGVSKIRVTFGVSRRYYLNATYGKGVTEDQFDIRVRKYDAVGGTPTGNSIYAKTSQVSNNMNNVIYRGQVVNTGDSDKDFELAGADDVFSQLYESSDADGLSDLSDGELVGGVITFIESNEGNVVGHSRPISAHTQGSPVDITVDPKFDDKVKDIDNTLFEIRHLNLRNPLDQIVEVELEELIDVDEGPNEFAIFVPFDKNVHWILIEEVQPTDREILGT